MKAKGFQKTVNGGLQPGGLQWPELPIGQLIERALIGGLCWRRTVWGPTLEAYSLGAHSLGAYSDIQDAPSFVAIHVVDLFS